jgi:8-oxo-dGTP diphosphatase
MNGNQNIGAGVACFVWRDGKFLMQRRIGSLGEGKWSVPGGHLDFMESWADCAAREVMEETGMSIKNIEFLAVTNDMFSENNKHNISIWMTSDWASGEPSIIEPDKCTAQEWHTFQDLPDTLFEPCWQNLRIVKPELFG